MKNNTKHEGKPLYEFFQMYISCHDMSSSYRRSFITVANLLSRYERYRQLNADPSYSLMPERITSDDLDEISRYYRNEYALLGKITGHTGKNTINVRNLKKNSCSRESPVCRSSNSQKQTMHLISIVWHWMLLNGHTQNNPFINYCIGTASYGAPIYISRQERAIIANFDLSDQKTEIQEARDIFIFQSLVGCRVSDLMVLTEENIVDGFLEYIPHKTLHGKYVISSKVPLVPMALDIINRYADYRKRDGTRKLFPIKSTADYNKRIKTVFRICGITRTVSVIDGATGQTCMRHIDEIASSHMARRTFAGNIYNKVKDPNIVCRMTGHVEGSKAFTRYRNIDDEVLIDAVKSIEL